MPQDRFIIATKTITADVFVFDYSKHDSRPNPDGVCRPDLRLTGGAQQWYPTAASEQLVKTAAGHAVAAETVRPFGGDGVCAAPALQQHKVLCVPSGAVRSQDGGLWSGLESLCVRSLAERQ